MSTAVVPKGKRKGPPPLLVWPLQIFVAIVLGYAGVSKLAGYQDAVEIFTQLGMESWGRYIIGLIEVGCAVTLLTKWASVGALFSSGVMFGAMLAHLDPDKVGIAVTVAGESDGGLHFMLALAVLVGSVVVLIVRRRELPMIGDTL